MDTNTSTAIIRHTMPAMAAASTVRKLPDKVLRSPKPFVSYVPTISSLPKGAGGLP